MMMLNDILVPTYTQMLGALSAWLGNADEASDDGARALLTARLTPDMFPLATQIRFACVQAQEGVLGLRQEAFPPSIEVLLNEGRNAADHPGSIADARARIAETLTLVEAVAADTPGIDPATPIAHALPQGMVFDLTAEQYVRDWALPQILLPRHDSLLYPSRARRRAGQGRLCRAHVRVLAARHRAFAVGRPIPRLASLPPRPRLKAVIAPERPIPR